MHEFGSFDTYAECILLYSIQYMNSISWGASLKKKSLLWLLSWFDKAHAPTGKAFKNISNIKIFASFLQTGFCI